MLEKQGKYVFEELSEDIPDCNLSVEDISIGNVVRSELVEFIKTLSEAKKQAVMLPWKQLIILNPIQGIRIVYKKFCLI